MLTFFCNTLAKIRESDVKRNYRPAYEAIEFYIELVYHAEDQKLPMLSLLIHTTIRDQTENEYRIKAVESIIKRTQIFQPSCTNNIPLAHQLIQFLSKT